MTHASDSDHVMLIKANSHVAGVRCELNVAVDNFILNFNTKIAFGWHQGSLWMTKLHQSSFQLQVSCLHNLDCYSRFRIRT